MPSKFVDRFSTQAAGYAVFRPAYPAKLYSYLASLCRRRCRVWDCATGSGQAARGLVEHFEQVVASDASAAQISHAAAQARINYLIATAEAVPLASHSVDLVVVAQALHWFDRPRFFAEVQRVLASNGVFAAWCYGLARISPAVDTVVEHLYADIVGSFWPEERRFIESGYAEFTWPYALQVAPDYQMRAHWTRDELVGYLCTWSAVQAYRAQHGDDPVALIGEQLERAWPGNEPRAIVWPLTVKVGTAG